MAQPQGEERSEIMVMLVKERGMFVHADLSGIGIRQKEPKALILGEKHGG
jgi:hypothetical protein